MYWIVLNIRTWFQFATIFLKEGGKYDCIILLKWYYSIKMVLFKIKFLED